MRKKEITMRRYITAALIAVSFIFAMPRTVAAVQALRISDNSDEMVVRIVIETDSPVQPKAFTLDNPPRLVVDLPQTDAAEGATATFASATTYTGDPDVLSVRFGIPATDTLRMVVDLNRLVAYQAKPLKTGTGVEIDILRQIKEETVESELMPGVKYTRYVRNFPAGPLVYHTVKFRLDDPHIRIDLAMGQDTFSTRERLTDIVARHGAALGVNGGYFDMTTGAPIDMLIAGGRMLTKQDRRRGFIGFGPGNKPFFAVPAVSVSVRVGDRPPLTVDRLNRAPQSGQSAVFTPEFGDSTKTDLMRTEIIVADGIVQQITAGDSPIPENGFVVSVDAAFNDAFTNGISPGETAELIFDSDPPVGVVRAGVTAGPMLVSGGVPLHQVAEEFTAASGITTKRHPRTAACATSDGSFIFAAFEGRAINSVGLLIPELADVMASFGCVDAINLDGGGSTEIVAGGQILNTLSEGAERPLANAFLIYYSPDMR